MNVSKLFEWKLHPCGLVAAQRVTISTAVYVLLRLIMTRYYHCVDTLPFLFFYFSSKHCICQIYTLVVNFHSQIIIFLTRIIIIFKERERKKTIIHSNYIYLLCVFVRSRSRKCFKKTFLLTKFNDKVRVFFFT